MATFYDNIHNTNTITTKKIGSFKKITSSLTFVSSAARNKMRSRLSIGMGKSDVFSLSLCKYTEQWRDMMHLASGLELE